jgi:hypothetical protein
MAEFAAECGRFRELESPDRSNGDDKYKEDRCNYEKDEDMPFMWVIEVDAGKGVNLGHPFEPPLFPHLERTDRDEYKTQDQHGREDEIGQQSQIRFINTGYVFI